MATQHYRVPNAQGYQSLVPQHFIDLFSAKAFEVLHDYYRSVSLNNISTFDQKIVSDISDIPSNIINRYFVEVPDSVGWEEYYNNGENKSQSFGMNVSHQRDGMYLKFRIKQSLLDHNKMLKGTDGGFQREMFKEFQTVMRDMAQSKLELHIWNRMFNRIVDSVDPDLQGANAGYDGEYYDWGSDGSPITFTPQRCYDILKELKQILIRKSIIGSNDIPYALVPPQFIDTLSESNFASILLHHRTDKYATQFADWIVEGSNTGMVMGGVLLVPDWHSEKSANGVYTILAGKRENNLSRMYMTNMQMYPETTRGDQMIWLGMDAGIGTAVKRSDGIAMFKGRFA